MLPVSNPVRAKAAATAILLLGEQAGRSPSGLPKAQSPRLVPAHLDLERRA